MISGQGGEDVPSQRSLHPESLYAAKHQKTTSTLKIRLEDIPIPDIDSKEYILIPDIDTPQKHLDPTLQETITYVARSAAIPILSFPAVCINELVQSLRDHSLIDEFIGFWPTEKPMREWKAAKWKPKAHFDLQLGSKGFFTIIFHHLEDKTRVKEGGPYFFNFAGMYLKN